MKKIAIISICIALVIFIIFFTQIAYKKINTGNNIINKSTSQIVDTILNMKSYSAKVSIKIVSNKNENNYTIIQESIENKKCKQEVLEPESIKGTTINYDGQKLELKNTRLNLNKVYENYPYLTENELLLSSFVEDYNTDKNSKYMENNNEIIMKAKSQGTNKYNTEKNLVVNKITGKPMQLNIKDVTQNIVVYILYNEIEIDSMTSDTII